MLRKTKEQAIVFSIGALAYTVIELLWRQHTHWSMSLTGGTCFSVLYNLYNKFQTVSLPGKCLMGSTVITSIEFVVGVIVNIWQKWDVWDYSQLRFNILGQICPLYSSFWLLLSIPIVYVSKQLKLHLKRAL
jgi:uncharacterized membrane protein